MSTPEITVSSRIELPGAEAAPSESIVSLWGIDGDLRGNESRMQACLPFLVRAGDPRVFAARGADWDLATGASLSIFPSEEEAARHGTGLSLPKQIRVRPGQLVVLFGPEFFRNLQLLKHPEISRWAAPLEPTPEGFRIGCLEVDNYERLAREISHIAKDVFDHEIEDLFGIKLSERAEAALAVLRNTGYALFFDQAIRTLVAEKISRKPDAYRKTLKLASLRLKVTPQALEQDVQRYLGVMLPPTGLRRGLGIFRVSLSATPQRYRQRHLVPRRVFNKLYRKRAEAAVEPPSTTERRSLSEKEIL